MAHPLGAMQWTGARTWSSPEEHVDFTVKLCELEKRCRRRTSTAGVAATRKRVTEIAVDPDPRPHALCDDLRSYKISDGNAQRRWVRLSNECPEPAIGRFADKALMRFPGE